MPGNSFNNRELAAAAGRKSKPGVHEKTKAWERLGEYITGELTGRMMEYVQSMPLDQQLDTYMRLLEYFRPRMMRTEIKAELDINQLHAIEKAFDGVDDPATG